MQYLYLNLYFLECEIKRNPSSTAKLTLLNNNCIVLTFSSRWYFSTLCMGTTRRSCSLNFPSCTFIVHSCWTAQAAWKWLHVTWCSITQFCLTSPCSWFNTSLFLIYDCFHTFMGWSISNNEVSWFFQDTKSLLVPPSVMQLYTCWLGNSSDYWICFYNFHSGSKWKCPLLI